MSYYISRLYTVALSAIESQLNSLSMPAYQEASLFKLLMSLARHGIDTYQTITSH